MVTSFKFKFGAFFIIFIDLNRFLYTYILLYILWQYCTVTRVTRGENIFNNKIYIGDLASIEDLRRPKEKYRGEYQEVPATLSTSQRLWGESSRKKVCASRCVRESRATEDISSKKARLSGRQKEKWRTTLTNTATARGTIEPATHGAMEDNATFY